MRRNFLTVASAAFFISASLNVIAQINDKIYGTPADYKAMGTRTLVVELLEENAKVIEKLSKNPKKAAELQEYKEFIADYNALIKEAVPQYWKLNTTIEYKTETETKKLKQEKSAKHVLLAYTELSDSEMDAIERSSLTVPALIYHRTEKPVRTPDYKIYLPSSYVRENNKYLPCDFKFALMQMQDNINWIIKNNKVLNFEDYAKTMATANCSKLASLKLLVEKDFLYKAVTELEAKENYGKNLQLVDADAVNTSYVNGTKGEAVLFTIPFGILKGEMGPVKSSALAFIKVIVDSETGEIYYL